MNGMNTQPEVSISCEWQQQKTSVIRQLRELLDMLDTSDVDFVAQGSSSTQIRVAEAATWFRFHTGSYDTTVVVYSD